jgi:hypothetical protein
VLDEIEGIADSLVMELNRFSPTNANYIDRVIIFDTDDSATSPKSDIGIISSSTSFNVDIDPIFPIVSPHK